MSRWLFSLAQLGYYRHYYQVRYVTFAPSPLNSREAFDRFVDTAARVFFAPIIVAYAHERVRTPEPPK